jgi:hypothetical protein
VHAPTEYKIYDPQDSLCEELEQVFDQFSKYHMKILLGYFNEKSGREAFSIPQWAGGVDRACRQVKGGDKRLKECTGDEMICEII